MSFHFTYCISGCQGLCIRWALVVIVNNSTLIRIWERTLILDCIRSSVWDRISSASWVRETLGLEANKDLRPILIFKVCHLLLLCCCKLAVAIHAWTHHCHLCVSNAMNRSFLLALTKLYITHLCLIAICPFLIWP